MDRLLASKARDGDTALAARGGTVETGLVMSMGSASSLTLTSETGGPRTAERLPATGVDVVGAAAMVVMGGVTGTAPGMLERAMAGWDGGLAAAIMLGMAGGGCWEVGGTAMVGCSAVWLDMVSKDTVTGVAMDTCTSDLGLAPAGLGDPDALRIELSTRGLATSGGCGGRRVFRTAIPSVVGFFRSMLGRGDEPWAGVLVLAL